MPRRSEDFRADRRLCQFRRQAAASAQTIIKDGVDLVEDNRSREIWLRQRKPSRSERQPHPRL